MSTDKNNGFMRLIIIVATGIVLSLVFGFSLRDNFSPEQIKSQAETTRAEIENFYAENLSTAVDKFISEPAEMVWSKIQIYIIIPIEDFIYDRLKKTTVATYSGTLFAIAR